MSIATFLFLVDSLLAQPPAPPVVTLPPTGSSPMAKGEPWLTTYRASDPSCAGGLPRIVHREEPLPSAYMRYPTTRPAQAAAPVATIRFRIDPGGRPLGISWDGGGAPHGPDVMPAFAAWRFEKGQERAKCEVVFERQEAPVSQADLQHVYRLVALVNPRQLGGGEVLRKAVVRRATPDGSDCMDRRLNIRLHVFPAFEQIPQADGTVSHSFMTFDLDATGAPVNVRLVGSGGNAELDRQSLDAAARSRFSPGERRGCIMWFYRDPSESLEAPLGPSAESLAPANSNCPTDSREPWVQLPPLVYPNEFRRRRIEGWAIVGYDLAPWGGVGNVQLLAAEPASPFGQSAVNVVRNGTKKKLPNGYRGCTTRARFEITDDGPDPEE